MGRATLAAYVTASLMTIVVFAGPNIRIDPSSLVVTEGGTIKFACSPLIPIALPILQINNRVIEQANQDPRLQYQDYPGGEGANRTYTISPVTTEDDGMTIVCNVGGFVSNTLIINVIVPLEISSPPSYVTILEGENTELTFTVTGDPFPHSITWLYNGQTFSGNERVAIVGTTLVMTGASRSDSGSYTLVVRNSIEEVSASTELQVVYNEFLTSPASATKLAGETVTLQCSHQFGLVYVWIINDVIVRNGMDKVNVFQFGKVLEYGPLDYTDNSLQIYCIAHLRSGHLFLSKPATLTVSTPPHMPDNTNTTAIEGNDIILDFAVQGHPPPHSFTFYYNGQQLLLPNGPISTEDGTTLLISRVSRNHTGIYTLVVANTLGEDSGSIELVVYYKPDILPPVESIVTPENRSVSLPCGASITSLPSPEFTWQYHDGRSISAVFPESQYAVLPNGHLVLESVDYSDAGGYTCNAMNIAGTSNVTVRLLVLDPPSEPLNPQVLDIGPTWVHVKWNPPATNGSLPLSGYKIAAFPQTNNSIVNKTLEYLAHQYHSNQTGNSTHFSSNETGTLDWIANSACVEVVCEPVFANIDHPGNATSTVTGLVPSMDYQLVIVALSNGTVLESRPSSSLAITTDVHVPGIGSVSASVHGPGTMKVTWTLAHSGGHPVLYFNLSYRRVNSTEWRVVPEVVTPGHLRWFVVHGLAAEELYVFRVLAANELGEGEHVMSEPVLSHHVGVPSQPTRPLITGWGDDYALLTTTIPRLGSNTSLSLTTLLLENSTMEVARHTQTIEDYEPYTELQVQFPNVSYERLWKFQVFASNYLGDSELSIPSLPAYEHLLEEPDPYYVVGASVGTLIGALNMVVIVSMLVFCVVKCRKSSKRRKSMARRVEMARASTTEDPFSPRSFPSNMDYRYSPEGRSNTHGTPSESCYAETGRRYFDGPIYALPASVSSVSAV